MVYTVTVQGFAFSPSALTVKVGDGVKWHNADGTKHSARHDTVPIFDTGLISPGEESDVITFDELPEKEITYHCEPHPHMHGTITVTCESDVSPPQAEVSG